MGVPVRKKHQKQAKLSNLMLFASRSLRKSIRNKKKSQIWCFWQAGRSEKASETSKKVKSDAFGRPVERKKHRKQEKNANLMLFASRSLGKSIRNKQNCQIWCFLQAGRSEKASETSKIGKFDAFCRPVARKKHQKQRKMSNLMLFASQSLGKSIRNKQKSQIWCFSQAGRSEKASETSKNRKSDAFQRRKAQTGRPGKTRNPRKIRNQGKQENPGK